MNDRRQIEGDARARRGRQALVLGIVSLPTPLAMNMYVPSFPQIAAALGTGTAGVQLSITSFLAALAVGQNVYGPASDRFGRKRPLQAGLALFVLASFGVSFAHSLGELVVWRFVQGFGACASMAITRAIVRDQFTGPPAAKVLAQILLVVSISPTLAPLAGSALAVWFDWRAIFWTMGLIGAATMLLVHQALPETLPPEERAGGWTALAGYGALLRNRVFVASAIMIAAAQSTFFAYLGGSASVYMVHFGLDSWQYSIVFALGAAGWATASQFAPTLMIRHGSERLAWVCSLASLGIMAALVTASLAGLGNLYVVLGGVLLMFAAVGVLLPTATVAALHPHGRAAGSASALIGTITFAIGAFASWLATALADGTELTMLSVMAGCAILSVAMACIALPFPKRFRRR